MNIWQRLENATVIGVDIDGTLCEEECYTKEEVLNATPRLDVIEKVNELSRTKFITLLTARRDYLISATLQWVKKNGIYLHSISNNKMPCDILIDDKVMNVEDFIAKEVS